MNKRRKRDKNSRVKRREARVRRVLSTSPPPKKTRKNIDDLFKTTGYTE